MTVTPSLCCHKLNPNRQTIVEQLRGDFWIALHTAQAESDRVPWFNDAACGFGPLILRTLA